MGCIFFTDFKHLRRSYRRTVSPSFIRRVMIELKKEKRVKKCVEINFLSVVTFFSSFLDITLHLTADVIPEPPPIFLYKF